MFCQRLSKGNLSPQGEKRKKEKQQTNRNKKSEGKSSSSLIFVGGKLLQCLLQHLVLITYPSFSQHFVIIS